LKLKTEKGFIHSEFEFRNEFLPVIYLGETANPRAAGCCFHREGRARRKSWPGIRFMKGWWSMADSEYQLCGHSFAESVLAGLGAAEQIPALQVHRAF